MKKEWSAVSNTIWLLVSKINWIIDYHDKSIFSKVVEQAWLEYGIGQNRLIMEIINNFF